MTKREINTIINMATKPALSHIPKTYSRVIPFLNVAHDYHRHTINLKTKFEDAVKIIQSLRK